MREKRKRETENEIQCMHVQVVESHVLSYVEHSKFQLLNIVIFQLHEIVSLSLSLPLTMQKRRKITWIIFRIRVYECTHISFSLCVCYPPPSYSLSYTCIHFQLSSWYTQNANIRTQIRICIGIHMNMKPCALFTPGSLPASITLMCGLNSQNEIK